LKEETGKLAEGGALLARSWLLLIVGLLARRYGRDAGDSPHLEMRLGRALSWIDQNLHRTVGVAELAARAAMSERTFLRRFREATGVSPVEYLLRSRIRRAMDLLDRRTSKVSMSEIAAGCGFEDSNYFSRQFRRKTGQSPSEYLARPGSPGADRVRRGP
jgi:transcriptional regulator GlxA family with amidase domain